MKKIFLLAVLLITSAAFAQTVVAKHPKAKATTAKSKSAKPVKTADTQTAYQPPVEVQAVFEDEFKSTKAVWHKDFGGVNKDEPRFVADFTMQGNKIAAWYDKDGVQKVLMRSVTVAEIPATAVKYLKTNYPTFTIVGAAKVKNENKTYTFEVGLTDKTTFYDTVFDTSGNFLLIRKKDK